MSINRLYLIIVVTIGADLIYSPLRLIQFVCLTKINGKVDRVLAECANIDLDFSRKFRNCLIRKLEATLIDSSTVE